MEKIYLNMYLTMKHYEDMKHHATYLPFRLIAKDHNMKDKIVNVSENMRERYVKSSESQPGLNNEKNDIDFKSEENDSRSSNEYDEKEQLVTCCNIVKNNIPNDTENANGNGSKLKTSINGHTDFSIERILSQDYRASSSHIFNKFEDQCNEFDWLKCTRYKPPKIQRLRKKEAPRKRTPGCNPRIPFSECTLKLMEAKYSESPYITGENLNEFARSIDVSKERIVVWFQNRRARQRREEESKQPTSRSRNRTGSTSSNLNQGSASVYMNNNSLGELMVLHPV